MNSPYSNGHSCLKVGLAGRDIFDAVEWYMKDLGRDSLPSWVKDAVGGVL